MSYTEIRSLVIALSKVARYRMVALYFMQHHQQSPGVPDECKLPLAKAYGVNRYDSDEGKRARTSFWDALRDPDARKRAANPDKEA